MFLEIEKKTTTKKKTKKKQVLEILKFKIVIPFRCFTMYMSQIIHVEISKKKLNFKFYYIFYLLLF